MIDKTEIMFTGPSKVELINSSLEDPIGHQVLIKVKYNLISAGTEKAQLLGGANTKNKYPINVGYSSTGEVIKIGERVKKVKIGDRVFVSYGGHANYNMVHEYYVTKIPDNVPLEQAVFTRIASFPLHGIRKSSLQIGESSCVVGLGMLGLFGIQLSKIAGSTLCIAIGNREERRAIANKYGADLTLDPNSNELIKNVLSYTQLNSLNRGCNVVLETSGTESGLDTGLKIASKHGRVILTGCNRINENPIDFYKYVHLKGTNIIGAHDLTRPKYNTYLNNWTFNDDYYTILKLMSNNLLHTKEITNLFVSPEKAPQIYDQLLNDKKFPLGVIFDWDS